MERLKQQYPDLGVEHKHNPITRYIGFHVTTPLGNGLNAEVQLSMPEMFKVKLATDAIYDKWRNKDQNRLTKAETRRMKRDNEASYQLWASYLKKSGITPEVLAKASASLTDTAFRITEPSNPSYGTQEPFVNSKNGKKSLSAKENATNLPPSVSTNPSTETTPSNALTGIIHQNGREVKVKTPPVSDAQAAFNRMVSIAKRSPGEASWESDKVKQLRRMLAGLVEEGRRRSGGISASEAERMIADVKADSYLTAEEKAKQIWDIIKRQK
jgi:hypothetical protein